MSHFICCSSCYSLVLFLFSSSSCARRYFYSWPSFLSFQCPCLVLRRQRAKCTDLENSLEHSVCLQVPNACLLLLAHFYRFVLSTAAATTATAWIISFHLSSSYSWLLLNCTLLVLRFLPFHVSFVNWQKWNTLFCVTHSTCVDDYEVVKKTSSSVELAKAFKRLVKVDGK